MSGQSKLTAALQQSCSDHPNTPFPGHISCQPCAHAGTAVLRGWQSLLSSTAPALLPVSWHGRVLPARVSHGKFISSPHLGCQWITATYPGASPLPPEQLKTAGLFMQGCMLKRC